MFSGTPVCPAGAKDEFKSYSATATTYTEYAPNFLGGTYTHVWTKQ